MDSSVQDAIIFGFQEKNTNQWSVQDVKVRTGIFQDKIRKERTLIGKKNVE